MLSLLKVALGQKLRINDEIRLSGGHESPAPWLHGADFYTATCIDFIPGQNRQPAAVVQFSVPVEHEGDEYTFGVLELRYQGARWAKNGVVHVELCKERPPNTPAEARSRGAWVESNAVFKVH